jgi:hypothetical protein
MPKSRNPFTVLVLVAGLSFAISSSPLHAQIVPLIRVIMYVGGVVEVLYSGFDRAQAEAVHRANPGSKLEFGSKVRALNDREAAKGQAYLRKCYSDRSSLSACLERERSGPDFDRGDSLKD